MNHIAGIRQFLYSAVLQFDGGAKLTIVWLPAVSANSSKGQEVVKERIKVPWSFQRFLGQFFAF